MFVVCPVVLVVVVVERPSRSVSRDELVTAVVLTVSGGRETVRLGEDETAGLELILVSAFFSELDKHEELHDGLCNDIPHA